MGEATRRRRDRRNERCESTRSNATIRLADESGRAIGFRAGYSSGSADFYYQFNAQGDIVGLLNASGGLVCRYVYDSWGVFGGAYDYNGNLITDSTSIAYLNPLRYRGYFYDEETGLYYLQSRYYDPNVGRFINADSQIAVGNMNRVNLFAYCGNNPINRYDSTGCTYDSITGQNIPDVMPQNEVEWGFANGDVPGDLDGDGDFDEDDCKLAEQEANKRSSGKQMKLPQLSDLISYYPPNDGFWGDPVQQTLSEGTIIQRTGNLGGQYAAPSGTPLQMLSLPYAQLSQSTVVLKVEQPVTVSSGIVAPWFDSMGGGIQYKFDKKIDELLEERVLIFWEE